MKYRVENQMELFEFHDAELSLVGIEGNDWIVSAKYLNIHKNTEQNPSCNDMEISRARITLQGFRPLAYEPGRAWKTGPDGTSHPVGPQIVFTGKDAAAKITEALQNHITVFDFRAKDCFRYFIDGCGIEPFFTIEFSFDGFVVEWEAYRKKAWYELHRVYRYDLTLETAQGEETVEATVVCHDEETYRHGEREEAPTVDVGIKYAGNELWGQGKDYTWVDAFADLQKQLPNGVRLKCCLTCKHGNMCPVGDKPGELFCTKDVIIAKKSDLYFYTEDKVQRMKRARRYCDICADYQPQSDAYFTYNDFPRDMK